MYDEILRIFKNSISFNSVSVDAVPFCKISHDKQNMTEMVSRPGYVTSESDKQLAIFLNGDITKRSVNAGKKMIMKKKCCFKAVEVRKLIDLSNYENEF